jgi:hypothetical protein
LQSRIDRLRWTAEALERGRLLALAVDHCVHDGGYSARQGFRRCQESGAMREGIPAGRTQNGQADDDQQDFLEPAAAFLLLVPLGVTHAVGAAGLLGQRRRPRTALVFRDLLAAGARSDGLRRRMRGTHGRSGPRGSRPARRLGEDHGGRLPIRKALSPKQIVRQQMAVLDELGELRVGNGPVLLVVAGEIPLRL